MQAFLNNNLVVLAGLVGLIVLMAMGKVSATAGLPVLVGLTGVHIGLSANNSTPTTTTTTTPNTTTTTGPIQ